MPTQEQEKKEANYSEGKKKKHSHGKEPVHRKSEGDENLQIKAQAKKEEVGKRHDYKVYKDNHPKLPNDVERMYDLVLWSRKGLSVTEIISTYQKGERLRTYCTAKRVQQESFYKENGNRTCYLQDNKLQYDE